MWQQFVNWLIYDLIGMSPGTRFGSAVNFFIYDTVKILFLLSLIIFIVATLSEAVPRYRYLSVSWKRGSRLE